MKNEYIHGVSKKEQARLSKLNDITNQSFIEYLEISAGMKVCDLGCGMGNLINALDYKYSNLELVGIEIAKEQFDVAKEINEGRPNIELINSDILENTLPSNYFDVTYCRYLLEHVQAPIEVIKEMVRITKLGGKIVVQENDLDNIIYYPTIEGHREVITQLCNLQIQMGGDPYIGRKLYSFFKEANVKNITLEYAPEIYTDEIPHEYSLWVSNSLSILMGAKEELLARNLVDETLFQKVCEEMKRRIDKPEGVSLFHWNRAKVIKE